MAISSTPSHQVRRWRRLLISNPGADKPSPATGAATAPSRWSRPRRATGLSASLAGLVALSACGLGTTEAKQEASSINIELHSYPSTFDPGLQYDNATYPVYRNIYDQLLRRDGRTLKPIPWIAKSWTQESPTRWRFLLRNDVKFSDGTPLTARDVAFSLNRVLDKKFNSPQFPNFSAVRKAAAINDTQVMIETYKPSPTLLSYLTTLSIVSEKYAQKVGNKGLNEKPIGSGAYILKSTRSGSEVVLTRNDKYWGKTPAIKDAIFRAVPNASTRVLDLRSAHAQLVTSLSADQAADLRGKKDVQILATPSERVNYLGLNTLGNTPTKNLMVRQAIAAAINYDSLIKNIERGYARPVNAVLTPLAFGYPKDGPAYRYDPGRARQLLAQSGMKNPVLEFPSSPAHDPQVMQAIQSDLQAVGFKVNITTTDFATFLKKVQDPSNNWGSLRYGRWSCSCLDADGVIHPLFRTGSIWSDFSNADFDAAVDLAGTSIDETKRLAAYQKAWSVLKKEVAGIGLFQEYVIYGAAANLKWQPDAVESMYLDQMSFKGNA